MVVNIPAQVISQSLYECRTTMRTGHRGVVLKPIPADVLHERRQLRNLDHSFRPEGVEWVVRKLTFAHIDPNSAR